MKPPHRAAASLASSFALLATLLGALGACGGEEEAQPEAPISEEPAPLPGGVLAELSIPHAGPTFEALRARLIGPMRAALPRTPADLFERMLEGEGPPEAALGALGEDAPVHALLLRRSEGSSWVVASLLRAPLPAAARRAGGPAGSERVLGGEEEGALYVVRGRRLIASADPEALTEALPYLATTALPSYEGEEAPEEGIHLRASGEVLGVEGRRLLEGLLESQGRSAAESIEREREAHEGEPELGDPEALVAELRRRAERWIAFLPDLEEAEAHLRPTPEGIELLLRAPSRAGSPLARELASAAALAREDLGALPAGAALAWWSPEEEAPPGAEPGAEPEGSSSPLSALARIAGDRISDEDRQKIEEAVRLAAAATGRSSLIALGREEAGAWALYRARAREGAPLDAGALDAEAEEALGAALRLPYLREGLSALLRCEAPPSIGRSAATSAGGGGAYLACAPNEGSEEEGAARVGWGHSEQGWAISLFRAASAPPAEPVEGEAEGETPRPPTPAARTRPTPAAPPFALRALLPMRADSPDHAPPADLARALEATEGDLLRVGWVALNLLPRTIVGLRPPPARRTPRRPRPPRPDPPPAALLLSIERGGPPAAGQAEGEGSGGELRLRLQGPGRAWAGMAFMGMAFGRGAPGR